MLSFKSRTIFIGFYNIFHFYLYKGAFAKQKHETKVIVKGILYKPYTTKGVTRVSTWFLMNQAW